MKTILMLSFLLTSLICFGQSDKLVTGGNGAYQIFLRAQDTVRIVVNFNAAFETGFVLKEQWSGADVVNWINKLHGNGPLVKTLVGDPIAARAYTFEMQYKQGYGGSFPWIHHNTSLSRVGLQFIIQGLDSGNIGGSHNNEEVSLKFSNRH